jgi:ABC-type lipoprotein export system ATPase subunit
MALMARKCRCAVAVMLAIPWVCLTICSAFSSRALKPAALPFASSTTAVATSIHFEPSQVTLDQVSLQYPDTLARRLFSSVPRRDFAVRNVSLTLEQEIVLLQGASSSGKSALMKLIAGQEKPTSGSAKIRGSATPIWLADKPDHDNQSSLQSLFEKEAKQFIELTPQNLRLHNCIPNIASTFSRLVHLDPDSKSFQKTPAQLSPSENYKIRLAIACLQSSLPGLQWSGVNNLTLPAPILLLDEWLDSETRETSSKVEQALLELVQSTGAVILCATHKPNLWKKLVVTESSEYTTQMTMCRGAILTLLQRPKRTKPQH